MSVLHRRQFLASSAWLGVGGTLGHAADPSPAPLPFTGRVIRETTPENLEMPFGTLDQFVTPTNRFYVRSHFPVPALDPTTWRLRVEGAVSKPLTLTLADVQKLASRKLLATLECAGNGRVLLPKVRGLQWHLGAVGTAEWTGVPLVAVLDLAGVAANAVDVVLEGADSGPVAGDFPSPGPVTYARSVPLAKAQRPETLLAWAMNGQPLLPAHGAPLRAVVGGWYGMAAVKWLTRVVVTTTPFAGFWQTVDYSYFARPQGVPTLQPITQMLVKSAVARPYPGEVIPPNTRYRLHGAAWTGAERITQVDLSFDAGTTWQPATLADRSEPHAWRLWHFDWTSPAQAQPLSVMSRATDSAGHSQPATRDPDRRTYMINHHAPIAFRVGA